jgi:hypothetical protein
MIVVPPGSPENSYAMSKTGVVMRPKDVKLIRIFSPTVLFAPVFHRGSRPHSVPL